MTAMRPHDFQADLDTIAAIEAVPTLLEVVCRTTGMGFAAIARVTRDRWIACGVRDEISFGLKAGQELDIVSTICREIYEHQKPVVIPHVSEDPVYANHHTPALYGFESYISMPIFLPDGTFFGTLCAIDPKPAGIDTIEIVGTFKLFAELIGLHIQSFQRLSASQDQLSDAQHTAQLREEFIAVLGHDLRNPLASLYAGAHLLRNTPLSDKATGILERMNHSLDRMSLLVDNLMDFARGRLGGGLTLMRSPDSPLESILLQVINELQTTASHRQIDIAMNLPDAVDCDSSRISQLLSNLLGNAITHGASDKPIRVEANVAADILTLSVINYGAPIPQSTMDRLFHPFSRGAGHNERQGLGLGLYIASEIALAHGGTLTAASSAAETRFSFKMPLNAIMPAQKQAQSATRTI